MLIFGVVYFIDVYIVVVKKVDGSIDIYSVDKFVIVTGLCFYYLKDVDFGYLCIYDSDLILNFEYDFCYIIIYGVGVIGCEYVFIFCGLDVKMDLINICDCLLLFLDNEVFDVFFYYFWNSGVVICNDEIYDKVEGISDGVIVYLKLGKKMCVDCLLYVNGCIGNIDKFNLELVGL